jgi:hypothetical protein
MGSEETSTVIACWHCGAPLLPAQKFCLTCGATRAYRPEQFSPMAVGRMLKDAANADAAPAPSAIDPTRETSGG